MKSRAQFTAFTLPLTSWSYFLQFATKKNLVRFCLMYFTVSVDFNAIAILDFFYYNFTWIYKKEHPLGAPLKFNFLLWNWRSE